MNSLPDLYKNLFSITEKHNEDDSKDNFYVISFQENTLIMEERKNTNRLSKVIYYVFIHMLVAMLFDNSKGLDIETPTVPLTLDILDFNLIKIFYHIMKKEIDSPLPKFLFGEFIITSNKKEFLNLISIIRDNKKVYTVGNTLADELVAIQMLEATFDGKPFINFSNEVKDKRKFGKYYSPELITEFIIKVFTILVDKQDHISAILDPSCGSGLFIRSFLSILENNIFNEDMGMSLVLKGIDIDFKALLTSYLLLFQKLMSMKSNTTKLKVLLEHKDFLLSDFQSKEQFNVILGNPPYIRERYFDKEYRKRLQRYKTFKGKSDLYFAFIEHSFQILKPRGYVAFIIPRYWLESNYGTILRKFLQKNFLIKLIIDFQHFKLFDIGVHSTIIFIQKKKEALETSDYSFNLIKINPELSHEYPLDKLFQETINFLYRGTNHKETFSVITVSQNELSSYWNLQSEEKKAILDKINNRNCLKLSSIVEIKEGINTGADKVSKRHLISINNSNIQLYDGIFVLTSDELKNLHLTKAEEQLFVKKWIKGKDIKKWSVQSQNKWLIYFKGYLEENTAIYNHLLKFKPILEQRAEMKRNPRRKWYELAWPRTSELFETVPKLLIRYKAVNVMVAIDEVGYYTSADFRILLIVKPYDPYVILGILNSELMNCFLKLKAKKLGHIHDYYSYLLREIPILYPKKEQEIVIKETVIKIVKTTNTSINNKATNSSIRSEIKNLVESLNYQINELYGITKEEIMILKKDL